MIHRIVLFAAAGLMLAACQQTPEADKAAEVSGAAAESWKFADHAKELRAQSCPHDAPRIQPQAIEITATDVELGKAKDIERALPAGVAFVSGWQLSSDHPSFGGLSGLAVSPIGELLSVSDAGAFVALGFAADAPIGKGTLAYMLDTEGLQFSAKEAGDAEGLALIDGMALVSFEQDFRVLAFDIGICGAGARGAPVAQLPTKIGGKTAAPNSGPEALDLTAGGGLVFGYEENGRRGVLRSDGESEWLDAPKAPRGYSFVGLANDGAWSLYRSYDPVRGNRNIVDLGDGRQITLKRPLLVDNFEGIAAGPVIDGVQRLWLISDDNLSDRQQTLLYAFDVTTPSP